MSVNEKMVLGPEAFDCGIQKRLVHAGKEPIDYVDGTKVYFHYKTIVSEAGTVIDDSKQLNPNKPMELIIGKKFKLEIWERAIKTMWLNEVAKFSVVKEVILLILCLEFYLFLLKQAFKYSYCTIIRYLLNN
jgi:hypothetical protein